MPDHNVDLRATARLPGLEIEVIHRRSLDRDREEIYLNLSVPGVVRFGDFLQSANPFLFWAEMTKLLWLEAARMKPSSATRTFTNYGSNILPFSRRT